MKCLNLLPGKIVQEGRMALYRSLSIISLREPDLEMIKANILTRVRGDYVNK